MCVNGISTGAPGRAAGAAGRPAAGAAGWHLARARRRVLAWPGLSRPAALPACAALQVLLALHAGHRVRVGHGYGVTHAVCFSLLLALPGGCPAQRLAGGSSLLAHWVCGFWAWLVPGSLPTLSTGPCRCSCRLCWLRASHSRIGWPSGNHQVMSGCLLGAPSFRMLPSRVKMSACALNSVCSSAVLESCVAQPGAVVCWGGRLRSSARARQCTPQAGCSGAVSCSCVCAGCARYVMTHVGALLCLTQAAQCSPWGR